MLGRAGATLGVMNLSRNPHMNASKFVALPVGVLLVAALFVAMYYDIRHRAAHYHGDVTLALPAHR
jgi:predicted lysophospholipase L1 biosynthesis ABC-type transport system permease subunit